MPAVPVPPVAPGTNRGCPAVSRASSGELVLPAGGQGSRGEGSGSETWLQSSLLNNNYLVFVWYSSWECRLSAHGRSRSGGPSPEAGGPARRGAWKAGVAG